MSERKNSRSAYTPNMETPTQKKPTTRSKLGVVLSFLLPPVGIAFLWRKGIFATRGRVLITALSTMWMAALLVFLIPSAEVVTVSPLPAAPVAATLAPNDGVVTALSNIDQLLSEQQAAQAALYGTPEPENELEAAVRHNAEQQAILDSTVYSVFTNAKYYHSREVCNTQSNRRALTVQDAMNEGMGACSNCDPPVFSGFKIVN